MEEKIVTILNEMAEYLTVPQMKKLQEVILQTFAENQKSGSALAKPLRKPYIANKTKNRSSFEKRSFGLSDRI